MVATAPRSLTQDPYRQVWEEAPRPAGSGCSFTAFVLAAIAIFILAPFAGTAAIAFAAFGIKREERLGRAALITAVLCTAAGVALGLLALTPATPGL